MGCNNEIFFGEMFSVAGDQECARADSDRQKYFVSFVNQLVVKFSRFTEYTSIEETVDNFADVVLWEIEFPPA